MVSIERKILNTLEVYRRNGVRILFVIRIKIDSIYVSNKRNNCTATKRVARQQ